MNYCGYQPGTFASYDELRSAVPVSDRKDVVICPKPRRLGGFNPVFHDPRPLRWQLSSHQAEVCESKAGSELIDLLTKGVCGGEQSNTITQMASSPPFFSGSPPSRATNPLIQDARFGEEKLTGLSPLQGMVPSGVSSSSSQSPSHKGGCARMKFGHKPAAVRIEGFDCLDRDRRNCSIPAVA